MNKAVIAFMNKQRLLEKNATVLVGVSGGPDSMALLHFLRSIREEWDLNLIAISVDHQLRGGESIADVKYVEEVCRQWEIPFKSTSVDVKSYKNELHVGTQVAAREMRYRFFEEQMHAHQASYLALGHHSDDQLETMLMSLVRTANSSALSGIPAKREFATGWVIRPLLAATRSDIETYCKINGITPRYDPSNKELTYTRNYFRNTVLPLIKEKNSNIHNTIQHLSETLAEDEAYLRNEAEKLVNRLVDFTTNYERASFEITLFKKHPIALQRRAYHLILNYLYKRLPKDLSYTHEAYFFSLLEGGKGNVQIDFPFDLTLEKSYNNLSFYFSDQGPHDSSYCKTLNIPGTTMLPDGTVIHAEMIEQLPLGERDSYVCKLEEIQLPLHIRTRKPGDRMRWKGLAGSKKVKDIFIDAKIPKLERASWPILVDDQGEILWLIGLKKGQPKHQANNAPYIHIYYERG